MKIEYLPITLLSVNQLQRISETHRSYDALQYPLLFCQGQDGYNFLINKINPTTWMVIQDMKVSAMEFYTFRMMLRSNYGSNHIFLCRQLFHQWTTDMYAKIETECLNCIRFHQKKLRVDEYIFLRDALVVDGNPNNHWKVYILPSTFIEGPRHQHEYTQDAMTYVRKYSTTDRHRSPWNSCKSFQKKASKTNGCNDNPFGQVRCWMYSVEWQKRGLPHAHILVWLIFPIIPNEIDRVISQKFQIPNKTLFFIILSQETWSTVRVAN